MLVASWDEQRVAWAEEIHQVFGPSLLRVYAFRKETVWTTANRAWRALRRAAATHLMLIQDDVVPCKNFLGHLLGALEANPFVPIALYSSRPISDKAEAQGSSWAIIPDGAWGQGVVLHRPLLEDFLAWERRHVNPDWSHDDSRLAMWAVKTEHPFWATVPSLVDHRGDQRSLLGHDWHNRARIFHSDPGPIDWTKGLKDPPVDTSRLTKRHWKEYRA